jgi:ubiquinone/menaquinone biosynthesis C-methylase UbiE
MPEPAAKSPPKSPLASPEPWDLVKDGYVEELWEHFSEFSRSALDLAQVAPGSEVLDVCTGPGTLAVQAAKVARSVVAADFSPRMLDELRTRAAREGLTNIELLEADGQALPLADGRFDRAFSMFGLIFFPDRERGFRELYRVLKPGGRAAVSSWRPFEHVPPLKAAFDKLIELMPELPFGKSKAPLGEGDEFRGELEAAGFVDVAVHTVIHPTTAQSPKAFWASMARSSAPFVLLRGRIGEERWSALAAQIEATLVDRFGSGPLEVAPQALVGIGTRA